MNKPRAIFFLIGIAGSGKGTQGEYLQKTYGWQWVEAGNFFREKAKEDSPLGRLIKNEMEQGHHMSDEISLQVVTEGLQRLSSVQPLLLDGFPRSAGQYALFKDWCVKNNWPLPKVGFYLQVPLSAAYPRLIARGQHTVAGRERPDDYQEAILERLKFFVTTTLDLVDALRQENKLVEIDGNHPIPEVSRQLTAAVVNRGL